MRGLNGKVAIVTGGGGGIGAATVRRLLEEGGRVVFTDWNRELGEQLASELPADRTHFVHGDVSDEAHCQSLVTAAGERFGPVELLVNNAGIRNYEPLTETSVESWQRMLGVNLMGYVHCAKACIRVMREQARGAVVNVASVRSLMAGEHAVQYDTSKAAILGLTRSAARDYAADGIRVNAVGPGPIYTPFHRSRAAQLGQTEEEYRAGFGAGTMLQRPAAPAEVASAIVFLASDDASYVTGTCLYVDGGFTARG